MIGGRGVLLGRRPEGPFGRGGLQGRSRRPAPFGARFAGADPEASEARDRSREGVRGRWRARLASLVREKFGSFFFRFFDSFGSRGVSTKKRNSLTLDLSLKLHKTETTTAATSASRRTTRSSAKPDPKSAPSTQATAVPLSRGLSASARREKSGCSRGSMMHERLKRWAW